MVIALHSLPLRRPLHTRVGSQKSFFLTRMHTFPVHTADQCVRREGDVCIVQCFHWGCWGCGPLLDGAETVGSALCGPALLAKFREGWGKRDRWVCVMHYVSSVVIRVWGGEPLGGLDWATVGWVKMRK